MTPIIQDLAEVSGAYDVLFCDLWGCVHDGVRTFPEAVAVLTKFRRTGGTVVLLTNAPRPRASVLARLKRLGMTKDSFDDVVSSGDAAQVVLATGTLGRKVYHLGPSRDCPLFEDESGRALGIERVPLEQAQSVVCTGLLEDGHTPEDYRTVLEAASRRNLTMLCANPDRVVDIGDMRIYCAGSIADAYTALGGEVVHCGKPYPPIYALARQRADDVAAGLAPDARILCIGDNLATDIKGAQAEGLDAVFVTGGLEAAVTQTMDGSPKPSALAAVLKHAGVLPMAAIGALR